MFLSYEQICGTSQLKLSLLHSQGGPGRALESPGERPGRKEPLRMKKNLKFGKITIKGGKKPLGVEKKNIRGGKKSVEKRIP